MADPTQQTTLDWDKIAGEVPAAGWYWATHKGREFHPQVIYQVRENVSASGWKKQLHRCDWIMLSPPMNYPKGGFSIPTTTNG